MAEGCNPSAEDELLREALKRTKSVLCDRLPIELLPTVLEGESVIGSMECKLIKEERNSVERSLKLLELMEKKSIPVIRRFLEALKSKSDFCGYEYLADMVYNKRAALAEKKAATTDTVVTSGPTTLTKRVVHQHPYTVKRRGTAAKRKRRAPSSKLVYVPIFTELETEFALLAAATSEAIQKLDPHSFHHLLYFLRHLPQVDEGVYPSCSEPLSVQDLLILLEESWNFANFHLADAIARFFGDLYKDDTLAARVASYKEVLRKELPVALIQCKKKRVRPKPLKSRALLALVSPEEQKGFYLQQILTCRQFLIHSLGIKAALFVGFDEGGSIRVFFSIPRAIVWHLVPILQTQLSVLCEMGITHVQVIGQFVVETESGKLTYWDQEVVSGAGASALWKRKMSKRMQEMECALMQLQRYLDSALAENAVELDQLRQERMALQLKLQSSKAEGDALKKRLEVVAQFREVHSSAVQPASEQVERPPPPPPLPPSTPPTPSTPPPLTPAQEESEPFSLISGKPAGNLYSQVVVPSVQLDDWYLPQPPSNVDHSHAFEILDCLERRGLITPEESVSLAVGAPDRTWADSLVRVLQHKSEQVIDAAMDALAPFQDTNSIMIALKCYSLLYRRGLLKVDDFMSPLISAVASRWAETLFLVQLSKSPGVLEASANVLLEVGASLDIISWFKVVASLVKENLIAKDVFYFPPAISFKRILFEQLNNKPWTTVDRCAGILAQHGKAEYAEALIRLKKCVDISLVPSTIFDSLHNHAKLDDPTAVGVPQFVLDHASDFSPAKVKKVAKLFENYGYHSLASSLREITSLSEQMRNPVDLLNRFSPHIQSRILRSLSSPVTSERLHVVYLLSEQNLATKDECSTMLAAILEQTFSQTVLRIQSTKTLDVLTKTADILEECTSFPTPAKQLRVLITFVKQLSLTAAERCRPQFRDLTSDMEATYSQWMGSLAGVVATRPAEDVEKAAAIFEQYNEPFLATRLKLLSRLVHEQLLSKEERQRVLELAFDRTLASRWEAFLLQLQRKKGKPTLVQTEEILQSLSQDV